MPRKSAATDNFSRRIPVLIKRDMTAATPRIIWSHEKPILEEVFGEGSVADIEDVDKFDEGYSAKTPAAFLIHNKKQDSIPKPSQSLGIGHIFIGDAASEYQRLADSYGKHADVDMPVVEKVYGRFQSGTFAKLLGKPVLADLPDDQIRSLIADYGYPGVIDKDATPEEKAEHAGKVRALREMTGEGLIELAESIGIEI